MLEIEVRGDIGNLLEAEFLRWGRRAAHNDLIFAVALASGKPEANPSPSTAPLRFPSRRPSGATLAARDFSPAMQRVALEL
jgi:hypothetical protein